MRCMGMPHATELIPPPAAGVEAVVMSAGELESEVAGKPGRLIRERYRKAADMGKVGTGGGGDEGACAGPRVHGCLCAGVVRSSVGAAAAPRK